MHETGRASAPLCLRIRESIGLSRRHNASWVIGLLPVGYVLLRAFEFGPFSRESKPQTCVLDVVAKPWIRP
jgi:hypothetical protein